MDKIRVVERMDDMIRLPLHLVLQDHAVCGVLGREGGATILHAEHNQRFAAIVVDGALAGRSYTHDASLLEGDVDAVNLVFSFAAEHEVELLVVLVGVVEASLLSRLIDLEREISTCGSHGLAAKDLAGNLDVAQLEHVPSQIIQLAEIIGSEILAFCNLLHLFHLFCCLNVSYFLFVCGCKIRQKSPFLQERTAA